MGHKGEDDVATGAARTDGPMALPRAFALLRLLAEERDGLNLSVIAENLSVPKSSLSSTLRALTDQELLIRKGSLYFLGPESFSLASAVLAGRSLRHLVRPYLEKTMESCGETALLAVLDSDMRHFTYIDIVETPNSVRYSVPVGTRRPLYGTAAGRLFLAFFPESLRRAYLDSGVLAEASDSNITERSELEDLLGEIRQKGVSVTMGDYSIDAAGFAAPIFDAEGNMPAAISIASPFSRGERERERYEEAVKQTARSVSKLLGYTEERPSK